MQKENSYFRVCRSDCRIFVSIGFINNTGILFKVQKDERPQNNYIFTIITDNPGI